MLLKIFKNYVLLFFILLLLLLFGVFKDSIINQLSQANLLPKAETFTELYFENSTKLPTKIISGKQLDFIFTIHNLEGKDINYTYEIVVKDKDGEQPITKKTVLVEDAKKASIQEGILLDDPATRSAVIVNLVNKKQHITFYVTESFEEL